MKQILYVLLLALLVVACKPVVIDPPIIVPGFDPITTSAEAMAFGAEQVFPCEGDDMIWEDLIPEVPTQDEFGYYGYQTTTLIDGKREIVGYIFVTDCITIVRDENGTATGGRVVYSLYFDPNNGWIKKLRCDNGTYLNCPEQIEMLPASDNPDYEDYLALI